MESGRANRHPKGITIDPSGAEGIWVVDAGDDVNNGDVLDSELAAALRLTDQLSTLSDDARTAAVVFAGDSVALDAGPELFNQHFIDPTIDTTYRGNVIRTSP